MENTSPPHKPEFRAWSWPLATIALLLLLGVFLWRTHEVKPYSDPLNWLTFAADFRTQFTESKWPFGYPLFLRGILELTGPLWVFLSNLPLLLLLGWMVVRLARWAEGGLTRTDGLAGTAALAFFIAANPAVLAHLNNPYRDPLSYALLLGGIFAFLHAIGGARPRPVIITLSGWLIGAAYCVRETSVVLLPLLFLAGVLEWARDRQRPFWKPVLFFALGLALGALPFVLQGYLASGQALKPLQSSKAGTLVPGMHLYAFQDNLPWALAKFTEKYTLAGWALIVVGALRLAFSQRLVALLVVGGSAVGYFIFYSFYYTHVPRYFFVTDLFFAPLAGLGVASLVGPLLARLPRPARIRTEAALAALLIGGVAWLLFSLPAPRHPRFKVADAARLQASLQAQFPAGSLVICDRNLCEIIRWLAPVESWAVEGLAEGAPILDRSFAADPLDRRLAAGQAVFAVRIRSPTASRMNLLTLLESHDLEPVSSFKASEFHLGTLLDRATLEVYRVRPWSRSETSVTLPAPGPGVVGLKVDTRNLRRAPARTYARLSVNGVPLDDAPAGGPRVLDAPRDLDPAQPWVFTLTSDAPVPADFHVSLVRADQPVVLDLGLDSLTNDAPYISEALHAQPAVRQHRLFFKETTLRLPSWWGPAYWMVAELECRSMHKLTRLPPARLVLEGGDDRAEAPLPYDHLDHIFPVNLRGREDRLHWFDLRVRVEDVPESPFGEEAAGVQVDRILLFPRARREEQSLAIADYDQDPVRHAGFHKIERAEGGLRQVWTQSTATFEVWIEPSGRPLLARLHGRNVRPAQPAPDPRAQWNGQPARAAYNVADDGTFTLDLFPPTEALRSGANRIEVFVTPWKPAADGSSRDPRTLGLLCTRLEILPAPEATP
jgi:hypothetical protein